MPASSGSRSTKLRSPTSTRESPETGSASSQRSSFRLRRRESRKGRNPKTGDKVDVPPKQVPYFKPGKELKDLINQADEADDASSAPTATVLVSRDEPMVG